MRNFCSLAVALGMIVAAAWGQSSSQATKKTGPAAHKSVVRRPSASAHPGAAPVRRPTTSASAAGRKKTPVKHTAVNWRNRQLAPTPERYREIQQALVAKGYLPAQEATGAWNQSSIDALKRFQTEQNLDASGKINSMSLIALGLGPKHDAQPAQIASPAPDSGR